MPNPTEPLPESRVWPRRLAGIQEVVARLILPMLAFLPVLVTLLLVRANAVNMPLWDDWERVPYIKMWEEGTLTWGALYAPHIDHRMFFPRIIMLLCNSLSGGDLRVEIGVSFAIVVAAAWGVVKLIRGSIGPDLPMPWGLVLVGNLLLFSPLQYENWLWAVQVSFFLPMTCLIWAIVFLQKPWARWKRLLVALAMALIGTHSFGHGFVIWPAVLGYLLLGEPALPWRQRLPMAAVWLAVGTVTIACYRWLDFTNVSHATHSYGSGPGVPPPSELYGHAAAADLLRFFEYLTILAGSLFSRFQLTNPIRIAVISGGLMIGLLVVASMAWLWLRLRRKGAGGTTCAMLPWLTIGWAVVTGLGAVAYSRMGLETGFARATSPRYCSISLYLPLSLVMLGGSLLHRSGVAAAAAAGYRQALGSGWLLGGTAALLLPGWIYGSRMMEYCGEDRLRARSALMFLPWFPTAHAPRIDADLAWTLPQAMELDRRGYLGRSLVKSLELAQFRPNPALPPLAQAEVFAVTPQGKGRFRVSGMASHLERPADLILITASARGKAPHIVGTAETDATMPVPHYHLDLFHAGRKVRAANQHLGWDGYLETKNIPVDPDAGPGETSEVQFWLFESEGNKVRRIRGSWEYDPAMGAINPMEPR